MRQTTTSNPSRHLWLARATAGMVAVVGVLLLLLLVVVLPSSAVTFASSAAAVVSKEDAAKKQAPDNNNNTKGKTTTAAGSCTWTVKQIPRVAAGDISTIQEFWNHYAEIPIIITGIADAFVEENNMNYFDYLVEHCPKGVIPVKQKSKKPGKYWADLEIHYKNKGGKPQWTIDEFIHYVLHQSEEVEDKDDLLYGFDMKLNEACPEIFQKVKIPRFFNECLLQTALAEDDDDEKNDKPGWPVMMIGPNRTSSALHVDRDGLPFWMMLLQGGQKYWRVLPYKANYHLTGDLYNNPEDNIIDDEDEYVIPPPPAYGDEFRGDVLEEYEGSNGWLFDGFNPDFEKYPKLCQAVMYEATLEVGEIMFIPNSALHGVQNIGHTIGISSNLLSPYDKAQRKWVEKECARNIKAGQSIYNPKTCENFFERYEHRAQNPGPERDVDYHAEYINKEFYYHHHWSFLRPKNKKSERVMISSFREF